MKNMWPLATGVLETSCALQAVEFGLLSFCYRISDEAVALALKWEGKLLVLLGSTPLFPYLVLQYLSRTDKIH